MCKAALTQSQDLYISLPTWKGRGVGWTGAERENPGITVYGNASIYVAGQVTHHANAMDCANQNDSGIT